MASRTERLLNLSASSRILKEQLLRGLDLKGITASCAVLRDLLPEEAFRVYVRLEGRRTERSGKSFVSFLLDLNLFLQHRAGDKIVQQLTSALSVSTRSTDLIGWYKEGRILGVVFTEVSVEK